MFGLCQVLGETRLYGSHLHRLVDSTLELLSIVVFWRLSSSAYKEGSGIRRWVQFSGLLKAFLILITGAALAMAALGIYINSIVIRPLIQMEGLSFAVREFCVDYKRPPGTSGEFTSDVISELRGLPNAKINTHYIDYLSQNRVESLVDRWGHLYRFRVDPPVGSGNLYNPRVIIISCGPMEFLRMEKVTIFLGLFLKLVGCCGLAGYEDQSQMDSSLFISPRRLY
jgi:hypothetical protein